MIGINLILGEKLYHCTAEENKTITAGAGKKESLVLPLPEGARIIFKYKAKGLQISTKKLSGYYCDNAPFDTPLMISGDMDLVLYVSSSDSLSEKGYKLPYNCRYTIGRSDENDFCIKSPCVSRTHCNIISESGQVRVEDTGSKNGIFLNGKRVAKAVLRSGDTLAILGFRIRLLNGMLYFDNADDLLIFHQSEEINTYNVSMASDEEISGGFIRFRRTPRTREALPSSEIVLAAAPSKGQRFERRGGRLASLLGTGAMFVTSTMVSAVSPALLAARAAGLISPIAGFASSTSAGKKQKIRSEEYIKKREEKYGAYIADQKAKIKTIADIQQKILNDENPSPDEVLTRALEIKRSLWERSASDGDFLKVRIGMGYDDLCVNIKAPASAVGARMDEDEVADLSEAIINETRIVDNIPARLDLRKYGTIGFIGSRKKVVDMVKNMLISLTALHSYEEVKIIGMFGETEKDIWSDLRWLPHIMDDNRQSRYLSFDKNGAERLCDLFGSILEDRIVAGDSYARQSPPLPHLVFLFGSPEMIQENKIHNKLRLAGASMGVTCLFLFDEMRYMPNYCGYFIETEGEHGPVAYERDKINYRFYFTPDPPVSKSSFETYTRRLSAIRSIKLTEASGIPSAMTFLQGYNVSSVNELDIKSRWASSDPSVSLAVPIGAMADDKLFSLDIHENAHGPHGLIAGTTGSGKSEAIQSWLLSLAVNFHPHDVSFILIDFKGGGMANLLDPLPHTIGKITNLGSDIDRIRMMFVSEKNRRMRIFEECGARDITHYRELYKKGKAAEILPHLVIVSDEFAELKKHQPDFLNGLISVAVVGRSLGLHLVLATQEPSGIVDDQITSNTNFKLCLMVKTAASSKAMIGTPDAAEIRQAGRAIIKAETKKGASYYETVQTFWSGAPYLGKAEEEQLGNSARIVGIDGERSKVVDNEKTRFKPECDELTAIVRCICKTADDMGIVPVESPLKAPLPDSITLAEISSDCSFDGSSWNRSSDWLRIPVGLYDMPHLQKQDIQYMDFAEQGHLGIFGIPSSGKTNLLKTIILSLGMNFTPKDINIYIIDCGGKSTNVFRGMPHVGGIAFDGEDEKIEKLQKLILDEMDRRNTAFLDNYVTSLTAYRETGRHDMPAIFLAIDNLPGFIMSYPESEGFLLSIAKNASAYGIYMLFTANGPSEVKYKILQNIKYSASFELKDRGDYNTIVGKPENVQLPSKTGTALFYGKPPIYFLAALFGKGNTEYECSLDAKSHIDAMSAAWKGAKPRRIPIMPSHITNADLRSYYSKKSNIPVGMDFEDVSPAYIDLGTKYCMLITGAPMSGKSKMLCSIAELLLCNSQNDLYVFDSISEPLKKTADKVRRYTDTCSPEKMDELMTELIGELNTRKKASKEGKNSPERQICIIIDDIKEFVDKVSDDGLAVMERIARLAEGLAVIIIAAGRTADMTRFSEIESLTRAIIACGNGLTMPGTPSQAPFFCKSLKYNEKETQSGDGNGFLFYEGTCKKIKLME